MVDEPARVRVGWESALCLGRGPEDRGTPMKRPDERPGLDMGKKLKKPVFIGGESRGITGKSQ